MVKLNIWEWQQLFNKVFNFTKWASKNFVNGDNIHKILENVYGNEEITIDEFVDACCEYIGDSDFVKTVNKYVNQFLPTDEKIINALNVRGISNKYKESARKSIKESTDDIITVKEFCFWGHSGNIVEIWTIDGVLCDSFEVRNVGKSEYKNYEIHGWDCAKNTVIIYIKK